MSEQYSGTKLKIFHVKVRGLVGRKGHEDDWGDVEDEVNEFIKDKEVVSTNVTNFQGMYIYVYYRI